MLEGWHEFYGLIGTAAAALVALLFVAASIGAGYLSAKRGSPTRTFTSPIVFHYTYVLFVSLVALVPVNTDTSLALIIGMTAAGGSDLFDLHPGRRDAQFGVRHRRPPRLRRQPAGRLRRGFRRLGIHLRTLRGRPSPFGRRADSFAPGQHPQRVGLDRVLCAAAGRRNSAATVNRV